jgi:CheY-like chemotaxis protein
MAKILIVNDEEDLVAMSSMILEDAGHEVATTLKGDVAIEIARDQQPDLILLDFVLSDTDGTRVMQALRAEPAARHIPVIMMSALHDGAERARRAGAKSFLQKPFTASELVESVARMNGVEKR